MRRRKLLAALIPAGLILSVSTATLIAIAPASLASGNPYRCELTQSAVYCGR